MTSQPLDDRCLRIVVGAVTYPPHINGAANFAHRLATGLARRGHDVHVVCHATNRQSRTAVEGGVTVHRIAAYGTPVHPTIRVCPPWRTSSAADRLLAEIQPDIVHVQSHFFAARGLIDAARRQGVGLVATNHFMPENIFGYLKIPRFLQRTAARTLWRRLIEQYRKAQVVTAPTPRAAQLLRDNGFPGFVLPVSCGIDMRRYRQAAARGNAQDRDTRNILFVGRLDEEKHIGDLLRAMSLLRTESPTQLEIIGDGNCRAEFEQLAAHLGVAERVRFSGFVDERELLDAYARADLFCMPSIAELQSLATLEAMSAATPVVLADAMALPHLVEGNGNGMLYPPGDIHALADAIDTIIGDRATIERMGAASARVAATHDIDAVLAKFEDIYQHTLARHQGTRVGRPHAELVH